MNGGYSLAQIGLHWLVALLVPVQYLTGGSSIERTHHAQPDKNMMSCQITNNNIRPCSGFERSAIISFDSRASAIGCRGLFLGERKTAWAGP